jgi:cell division septation protein DedD
MPTMVTFRTGRIVLLTVLAIGAQGCSREQQDWRSAESADTTEGWSRFVEQHPDSELATKARERIARLEEARDWQHASALGTLEAFRAYLTAHPSGKFSEDARIRIEAYALGSQPRMGPPTAADLAASQATGVRALQLAAGPAPAAADTAEPAASAAPANAAPTAAALAQPGEAAQAQLDQPPAPPPVPVTAASLREENPLPASGYGVQLGAFGSQASADREWQRLQGRFGAELGGLSPRIVVASSEGNPLFRLQAPAAGEAQARALCNSLKEQAQACVPVLPH